MVFYSRQQETWPVISCSAIRPLWNMHLPFFFLFNTSPLPSQNAPRIVPTKLTQRKRQPLWCKTSKASQWQQRSSEHYVPLLHSKPFFVVSSHWHTHYQNLQLCHLDKVFGTRCGCPPSFIQLYQHQMPGSGHAGQMGSISPFSVNTLLTIHLITSFCFPELYCCRERLYWAWNKS